MCGLAGPLHGLANQEVLVFLNKMQEKVGKNPTDEQVKQYVMDTLSAGQVSSITFISPPFGLSV